MSCRVDDPTICLKVSLVRCIAMWLHVCGRNLAIAGCLHTHGHRDFIPWPLQCEDYCSTGGCDGHFVTAEGGCSGCSINAAACDDLTAEIRECRRTFGLVGGECRPCRDPNCDNCDGEGVLG